MRIYALEVLFAACILNVPAAGSEQVRQDSPTLPQFIPPTAGVGVSNAKVATDDTRRAAEALSAKFSEDQASSTDGAAADREKSKTTAPVADDLRLGSPASAHVAVLRARPPKTPDKSKGTPAKTAKSGASKSRRTKADTRSTRRPSVDAETQAPATNPVPGAKLGWQTGVIGMLTNPAFWH